MMNALDATSTRPYLLRALYEWCSDNGFTPYLAVLVDDTVQVPREYVKNGEIVLNIHHEATSGLQMGNEFIEFKARFAGAARQIVVPVARVLAIYARENGQGMAFPVAVPPAESEAQGPQPVADSPAATGRPVHLVSSETHAESDPVPDDEPPRGGGPQGGAPRPALKRVK